MLSFPWLLLGLYRTQKTRRRSQVSFLCPRAYINSTNTFKTSRRHHMGALSL
jgi:hypothetical protein